MAKYTHQEAQDAAERFTSLYGMHTTVASSDFPPESDLVNYSFVGIHLDGYCVSSFSSEAQFDALRKLAYLITQTDQDLRQEESLQGLDQFGIPLYSS